MQPDIPQPVSPPALTEIADLLEALYCGAVLLDRSGQLIQANARACQMLGRQRADVVGHSLHELYTDEEGQALVDRRLERFDQAIEAESFIERLDGSRLPVVLSGRSLGQVGPLSNYRLVTLIDISAQKKAEATLQERYDDITRLSDTILEQALELKDYSKTLERRVAERTAELRDANMDAIYMLAIASEAKDQDTGAHVRRIQYFAELLAREVGLSESEAQQIGYSSILHDIGKIHVPDDILRKPSELDDAEWDVMREHTLIGERILSDKPFFAVARQIARHHHEDWDGSGYPDGLSGEGIPMAARIVHLADVFDALTSARPYKEAWTHEQAMQAIVDDQCKAFDPVIVRAFVAAASRGAFTAERARAFTGGSSYG